MEYCLEMTDYQLSISLLQDFSVLKDFELDTVLLVFTIIAVLRQAN